MKRFQILFLSCLVLSFTFSIFAQDKDTKEVIILQTSDVHSRIEPVNQKGDEYYNKGGFFAGLLFSNSSARSIRMCCFSTAEIFLKGHLIIICSAEKWKLN